VTQEDRDQADRSYPKNGPWHDAEIEMMKALGHL